MADVLFVTNETNVYFNDTNTTDWGVAGSAFDSCYECEEAYPDTCWCWEAQEGDYLQVFTITAITLLMSLATYCLTYQRLAAVFGAVSEMNFDDMKSKNAWGNIGEVQEKYIELGFVSGIPSVLYVLLNAIIVCGYFAVKLIIYFVDDPHYLSTINNDFNSMPFGEFYDARIILLVTLYIHSAMTMKQNLQIYKANRDSGSLCSKLVYIFCSLIFLTDFIGSIVLMCIKYPLIITGLYNGAVGIMVNCGVICAICCVLPLVACYGRFITFFFVLCACNKSVQTPCGRYMRGLANGFTLLSIGYLLMCTVLCFAFLFLGGPNYSVIYLIMEEDNWDFVIFSIYACCLVVGIIGFCIGSCWTLWDQCHSKNSKRRHGHKKIDNDEYDNDLQMGGINNYTGVET